MRLIDADANIETMKKCAENPENEQALLCYRYTQRILEEAPTVEPASPWRRVKDWLPEIGQIVLVYDEWRRLSICQLDYSYRWLRQGGGWFNGPCACYWMPIEPPKEDA